MRGLSVRGARRLTSGGVLSQSVEHGEQAQRGVSWRWPDSEVNRPAGFRGHSATRFESRKSPRYRLAGITRTYFFSSRRKGSPA
jgi:hypothetical protein